MKAKRNINFFIFIFIYEEYSDFEHLFDSQSLSTPYGNTGGFVSADGTYYSNDQLAYEAWENYSARRQNEEQNDYNNIDVIAAYDVINRLNNEIANAGGGMMYNGPGLGDPPDGEGTKEEEKGQEESSSWAVNVAEGALLFISTDISLPEASDMLIYKWVGYGFISFAALSVLYYYDEPFPKPWTTSRGKPCSWGRDPVIKGFENDKFYGNEPPPNWTWPFIGGAMGYELYKNWPSPDIQTSDTLDKPVIVPYRN